MKRLLAVIMLLPLTAAGRQAAEIEFSDGKVISGKLELMGSRPLIITPSGAKRQQRLRLDDIVFLNQIVREQSLNRPWFYREAGKPEKAYLEGRYPFINFTTEIGLTNGEVMRGDIVSTVFRFTGPGDRKLFLTRQLKGEVGQKLSDLVYPVRIKFANRKTAVPPIKITLLNAGKIESAAALDNQREVVRFGKVSGNTIVFDNLFAADYDIYILTDRVVLGGLSAAAPADRQGDALPPDTMTELQKVFPLADDFFRDRRIAALNGKTDFCKTLVYKRRETYYAADRHTPGGRVWHLDIWSWHRAGKEWKIDRRYILIRHKQQRGELNRRLFLAGALGAVRPGAELKLDFNSGQNHDSRFIRQLD
ncbi:MAG: hypothetical protein PHH77_03595 [Victivallaceae bacterium]|nr:hypothetical protein [Victivallaceae bacterium]